MAFLSSDRFLWICLGVTLYFAGRGILAELHRIRDLTAIRNADKDENVLGEATEDALNLDTLQKLSEAPSYELRSAALKIVSERASKGSTRDLLLEDLSSKNPNIRSKALNALHFLVSNRTLNRTSISARLQDVPTFTAVINCLCNLLNEHTDDKSPAASPVLPGTRPVGESKAMATLNYILAPNIPAALEAGVIRRWLAKYPFPCAVNDEYRRRDVFMHMKTLWSDDPVMSSIVNTLASHPDGEKELKKYHLMWGRPEERFVTEFGVPQTFATSDQAPGDSETDSESDIWMVDGDDTAGAPYTTRRLQERSPEEQALRRRRREAMVFSEGGRPLQRDDIIQPVHVDENGHVGGR